MLDNLTPQLLAGQIISLVGLALCIAGFSSKRDDRLLVLLIGANIAFAIHFLLFSSWTAAALTLLIIVRIALARRFYGSWTAMTIMLLLSALAAAFTWQGPIDIFPMTAAVLGTVGMFILRGIPMRIVLAGAALAWTLNNILIGSIGGTLTEAIIFVTNLITIGRLVRAKRRGLLPS
ncbi:inner membrane protein [Halospina denitrificans]|uniref:Inner membrane protein n=1 Tax=Halospina denitrificans TaxID=332522 RepID=A0A4R7K109_9GAMM|nr:YgjV family protein [Halospina denitrificans]TDT43129.1 inner membrane protein [Halospina denitrificans]